MDNKNAHCQPGQQAARHSALDPLTRDILDSVDANVVVLDAGGIIVAVNKYWQRYAEVNAASGCQSTQNTDIGTDYLAVCRQGARDGVDSAQVALEGLQVVMAGQAPHFRFEYPCHTPTEARWYEMSVSPMSNDSGGVVVLHTDITDRKLAELAQVTGADHLTATLESTRDGILAVASDGEVLFMNRRFRKLWDVPDHLFQTGNEEQLLAHAQRQTLDPRAFMDKVQALYQAPELSNDLIELVGGRFYECHYEPLRSGGETIGRVWSFHNITERKRAELDLRIFRRVFEATEQAIEVADSGGYLLYSNAAHDHLVGYQPSELQGQHFTRLFSGQTMQWAPEAIMGAVHKGDSWQGLLPIQRKDGSEVITASSVGFIAGSDGRLQYMFNILSDYTSELQRQQQLAVAKEKADRANQAKSVFLSSMSHELRTPLNAILGFAQILEYDDNLDAEQKADVLEILKAGDHLLELINGVLDLSTLESGQVELALESVDIGPIVEECLALVQPLAQKRALQIQHAGLVPAWVCADRTHLKQTVLNLLSNAIKYNRDGGRIRLDVVSHGEDRVRILVSDTGRGLSPDEMSGLFQPFNRLGTESEDVEGTGIGLSITRRIMETMGGSVGVESEVGVGSTFWLEFPASPPPARVEQGSQQREDGMSGHQPDEQQHLILLIEDNPANLRLVSSILDHRPHTRLLTARRPELGLELARAHKPALILLDINMPGMDGYQVLETLKQDENLREVPVLAVTASAMPGDIERGKQAGFADYITKPIQIGSFLDRVNYWLAPSDRLARPTKEQGG